MKLRLNNKLRYLFYVALACVSTACSFQEVNRDRLGHEPHLMIDKDGSVWIVEHHTGDLYLPATGHMANVGPRANMLVGLYSPIGPDQAQDLGLIIGRWAMIDNRAIYGTRPGANIRPIIC